MTDLEQAVEALLFLEPLVTCAKEVLVDVVSRNQNPNVGGDRLLTEEEWSHLRSASAALQTLSHITARFKVKPPGGMPYVGDGPALAELDPAMDPFEADLLEWDIARNRALVEPTVISTEPDGLRVFALLSDDRMLVSKELDDKHCAELHAEQVGRLKLSVSMLVDMLKWTEFKE